MVYRSIGKPVLDVMFAIVILILTLPLLLLLAVLVRLKLGPTIIFSQNRLGLHGRPFKLFKFRTMLDLYDGEGDYLPDADRLTSLGRFLRTTSLDELPELFNVLKGEMSLVGPRPLLPKYWERYTSEQKRRHEVKLGITGWAQVHGRNALSWEEKFKLDVWYVDHQSFWLDLRIIFMTLWKILKCEGINRPGYATVPEFQNTLNTLPIASQNDDPAKENFSYKKTILEHYRSQAVNYAMEPRSTMLDLTTREIEVSTILSCIEHIRNTLKRDLNLLEIGCGNGYLLEKIRETFLETNLTGVDYSFEMLTLATQRRLKKCGLGRADAMALPFASSTFDVVVSERCLINLLNSSDQDQAFKDIHRVLIPEGHLILIEAFTDGLDNLNRARMELGLAENRIPPHNLWFSKELFLKFICNIFHIVTPAKLEQQCLPRSNFLSSHYFISRVVYPCLTKREVLYNTEFVKFFRFLPPQGNYSPIQFFLLQKLVK